MADDQQFCTFFIDGVMFGVEVLHVQEVIRFLEMTRVPLAPEAVRGLINLRGQIVTAIDLRRRLQLPDRAGDAPPMNVVVRIDDEPVSLLVDEIGDVLEVDKDGFEHPPETMDRLTHDLIREVYKLPDRLLLILDIEKIVNLETPIGSAA